MSDLHPITCTSLLEEADRTPAVAYLARQGHNTRNTYGTWSGEQLDMNEHFVLILRVTDAGRMFSGGSEKITVNQECVNAQSTFARAAREKDRRVRLNNEINVATRGADADITYSVDLLDALGTDQWTEQLEQDAIEFLEEVLDRDVDEVTAELLTECRRVRRQQRDAHLAKLEAEYDALQ